MIHETHDKRLIYAGIALIFLNLLASFFKGATDLAIMGPVTTILITVFSFTHGMKRYGLSRMVFFVAMISVVSWGYESLSILTGFPFGNYHYTDVLGLKIGLVPVIIMPAYFAVGYLSWVIAHILLNKKDGALRDTEVFFVPVVAAFIMVLWDICMDPINSTITQMWIWHDGGGYFGVPLSNYLGWYLCVVSFYLIFAFTLRNANLDAKKDAWIDPAFSILPVLMYVQHVFEYFGGAMFKTNGQVTSQDGHIWWISDIYSAMSIAAIFTMIFVSVLALISIQRSSKA